MGRLVGETAVEAAVYATLFGLLAWYASASGSGNALTALFFIGFVAPVVLLLSVRDRFRDWMGERIPASASTVSLPHLALDQFPGASGFTEHVDRDTEETCLLIEFEPGIDVAEREALGAIIGSLDGVTEVHAFASGRG